jgi:hypothetical protein
MPFISTGSDLFFCWSILWPGYKHRCERVAKRRAAATLSASDQYHARSHFIHAHYAASFLASTHHRDFTQRSIKNQRIGDLYRIYSVTKRDGIDFNLASIPSNFSDTSNEPFDQKYMIALFDRVYNLASHHYFWVKVPLGMELAAQAHN